MVNSFLWGRGGIFLKDLRQGHSINEQQRQEMVTAHLAHNFQTIKARFLLPASALSTGRQQRLPERETGQSSETWVLVPVVSVPLLASVLWPATESCLKIRAEERIKQEMLKHLGCRDRCWKKIHTWTEFELCSVPQCERQLYHRHLT